MFCVIVQYMERRINPRLRNPLLQQMPRAVVRQ
jgi:hypothetical protein